MNVGEIFSVNGLLVPDSVMGFYRSTIWSRRLFKYVSGRVIDSLNSISSLTEYDEFIRE